MLLVIYILIINSFKSQIKAIEYFHLSSKIKLPKIKLPKILYTTTQHHCHNYHQIVKYTRIIIFILKLRSCLDTLAQGILVNFKSLLRYNHNKLPFAAAQIGTAIRKKISPRARLFGDREFAMAEIVHFHDPGDKSHSKFETVKDTMLLLYSANDQMDG